jgi:hypothetical protein
MKKYLVVFAALALVFAGCKDPNNNPTSEYTKIAFKDASVSISPEEQLKLTLVWEPTSLEAPVCEWSTSDTSVVTVKNGVITGVAAGEAKITAKLGDLTAVCNVNVMTFEESWAPSSNVYYFPSTKSAAPVSDTTLVYETSKATYTCKLYSVQLCIPSDVAIPGDEDGAGDYIFVTASIPFIESSTSGQYIGEPWDLAFQIAEDYNNTPYGVEAGSLDPAIIGNVWQAYFEAVDAGSSPSFDKDLYATGAKGAHLRAAIIQDGSIASYPWFDAIITGGVFYTDYNEEQETVAVYQLKVHWCAGALGTGLALNEEAQSYSEVLAKPYALDLETYIYEDGEKGKPYGAPKKQVRAKKDTKAMINLGKVEPLRLVKGIEGK